MSVQEAPCQANLSLSLPRNRQAYENGGTHRHDFALVCFGPMTGRCPSKIDEFARVAFRPSVESMHHDLLIADHQSSTHSLDKSIDSSATQGARVFFLCCLASQMPHGCRTAAARPE